MNIPEDYRTAFKGGGLSANGGRWKKRKPLNSSARQAARRLLDSPRFTARDEAILETLLGVGLMSREQIQRLFFQGKTDKAVTVRLKKLYENHLLDYSADLMARMRMAGMEVCHVYGLGTVGEEILAIRRGLTRTALNHSGRYDLQRGNPLLIHDLQVSEVYVQAKGAMRKVNGQVIWYNEQASAIRNLAGEELVRPDGTLVLIAKGAIVSCFVEMDRGSTHWPNKVGFYEHARRNGDGWQGRFQGVQFPVVLAIIPPKLVDKVSQVLQESHSVRFLLKTWPELLLTDFLQDWRDHTANCPVELLYKEGLSHAS